jgi:phospholipase C
MDNVVPRRQFLRHSVAAGAALGTGMAIPNPPSRPSGPTARSSCASLSDIQHVIIFIQENRSFDHYFGTLRGVRGFADPDAIIQSNGLPVFYQNDPANTSSAPVGTLLPLHLNTLTTDASCTHDVTHDWVPQHQSWNNGLMDAFARVHAQVDGKYGDLTMAYYNELDLPYYYAVAKTFTICDSYFSSVIGPTDPNRLYTMSATVDPNGRNGGPLLQTLSGAQRASFFGRFTWTTMPERLEAQGISWKVYAPKLADAENNVLEYFQAYQNQSSDLYQRGIAPSFPDDFVNDVQSGNLPQVSWIISPLIDSEHPPSPTAFGEHALNTVVQAIFGAPNLWRSSVIFATFDENGGFFDHVPPVTAPPGTPNEYITAPPVPDPSVIGNPPIYGPIGLGFRVPLLVISPFSQGGFVSSAVFDHTSTLRFLETRFGVEVPNLSAWRRSVTGDLTAALNLAAPNFAIPTLPPTPAAPPRVIAQCLANLLGEVPYPIPNPQVFPRQQPGKAPKPSGPCS